MMRKRRKKRSDPLLLWFVFGLYITCSAVCTVVCMYVDVLRGCLCCVELAFIFASIDYFVLVIFRGSVRVSIHWMRVCVVCCVLFGACGSDLQFQTPHCILFNVSVRIPEKEVNKGKKQK